MISVYSKALDKTIKITRLIGKVKGEEAGPTLIFVGGIHGNEPAGIFALKKFLSSLKPKEVKGSIYALAGNISALMTGERYIEEDLNRVWTKERVQQLPRGYNYKSVLSQEVMEQMEINRYLQKILEEESGPFYFFDLHTTSSDTLPFLTVNDSLLNRAYTSQYPLPIILGIEEYLEGPVLSYINELGYVAFGFEAGQHDTIESIDNCIAFIYLSLIYTEEY